MRRTLPDVVRRKRHMSGRWHPPTVPASLDPDRLVGTNSARVTGQRAPYAAPLERYVVSTSPGGIPELLEMHSRAAADDGNSSRPSISFKDNGSRCSRAPYRFGNRSNLPE
jgi:hypothetical protein